MIDKDEQIIISGLDFNKVGDRVYDFSKVNNFTLDSPDFVKGSFDGYFKDDKATGKFFRLLALYVAYNVLYSIVEYREGKQILYTKEEIDQLLKIYDNFNTDMPSWKKEG